MQATFPRVEFLRILFTVFCLYDNFYSTRNFSLFFYSRLKKRKENSSSYLHALHKTANWEVSRRSQAVDVEKCTKKRDARAELLF